MFCFDFDLYCACCSSYCHVVDFIQAEVEGVNEEEKEEDRVLTLEELLSKVGLQEKKTLFEQEQIDMESLVS